jgi:benzoylformate decarboxylase
MQEGVARDGSHLLPAFPYYAFTKLSDDDVKSLYAYLMAQPAVSNAVPVTLGNWWEQVCLTKPRSFFCGAGGALGFALPAAVGASLAFGKRPVIALVGDGSANYSITGLWTAAQQNVPCTFVIVRNGVYEALKDYGAFLRTTDLPGMNLPGIDFVSLAAGYGVPGRRVSNGVEMADALKAAIDAGKPSLLEVEVEPTNSGMF